MNFFFFFQKILLFFPKLLLLLTNFHQMTFPYTSLKKSRQLGGTKFTFLPSNICICKHLCTDTNFIPVLPIKGLILFFIFFLPLVLWIPYSFNFSKIPVEKLSSNCILSISCSQQILQGSEILSKTFPTS